jgi:hypothetical protein
MQELDLFTDDNFRCFHLHKELSAAISIARSNEILGWEGVGNRQLLCFFKA